MAIFAPSSRKASRFAIAAALMSVGALGVTSLATPAEAQRLKQREKDKEREQGQDERQEQGSSEYSRGFQNAFAPIDEALRGENPDYAALKAQADAARSEITNDADRFFFGSTYYNLGVNLEDLAVQREGMSMMLDSGKVPEANVPQYTFVAGQLAYNTEDYAAARQYMERAVELGYEVESAREYITSSYAREGNASAGLSSIAQQINEQVAAGETPSENLIKQGLTIAYNNDYYEDATNFSLMLVDYYPSKTTWADAVAIQRNYGEYSDAELLDLLRLARAADAMREARDYTDYIAAANFRRLPAEVSAVAQEGLSAGLLQSGDAFVSEAVNESRQFASGLRDDLGSLESDARASRGDASDAIAAADAYLNFNEAAQAAELYELALTRPGVDQGLALTRLGIAQIKTGDFAAAQETLAKVNGNREPIAKLWSAYAAQQASGGATATVG